jgi:hypothetical protein
MERREFFKYTLLASAVPIVAGGIIGDIAPAAAAIVPVAPPRLFHGRRFRHDFLS